MTYLYVVYLDIDLKISLNIEVFIETYYINTKKRFQIGSRSRQFQAKR